MPKLMTIFDTDPIDPRSIPSEPRERATWIIVQLRQRGYSLRRLSEAAGYSHTYVGQALIRPLLPGEEVIADALGTTPSVLFAERYDRRGRRLHPTRAKDNTPRATSNVKDKDVIQL